MKVAVLGAGVMGSLLAKRIEERPDFELTAFIDPLIGETLSGVDSDIVIDFSHPDNLEILADYALQNNVKLLIATTGFSKEQVNFIHELGRSIPVLFTANTSLGVNLVGQILSLISPILEDEFDIELIEKHHNKKIDSPSGTAKYLINTILKSLKEDLKVVSGREGSSKREQKEIGVHALRGGTIVGEHNVIYAGNDEIIEIKHTALSKSVFVDGALKAANFLKDQPKGIYTMRDVLSIKEKY